jgi:hypothetical protein
MAGRPDLAACADLVGGPGRAARGRALPLDRGHPDHWIVRIHRTGVPVGDIEVFACVSGRCRRAVPRQCGWDVRLGGQGRGHQPRDTAGLGAGCEVPVPHRRSTSASDSSWLPTRTERAAVAVRSALNWSPGWEDRSVTVPPRFVSSTPGSSSSYVPNGPGSPRRTPRSGAPPFVRWKAGITAPRYDCGLGTAERRGRTILAREVRRV